MLQLITRNIINSQAKNWVYAGRNIVFFRPAILIIIICTSLLFGCNNKTNKIKKLSPNSQITYELDTLSDFSVEYIDFYYDKINEKEYFLYLNSTISSIYVYNYRSSNLLTTIPIPNDITGWTIQNLDSIFLIQYITNKVFLINFFGKIIKEWDLTPQLLRDNDCETMVTNNVRLFFQNNFLFIRTVAFEPPPDYYSFPIISVFRLYNDSLILTNKSITFPRLYKEKEYLAFYPSFAISPLNDVIVSYNNDDFIYLFKNPFFTFKNKFLAKSNFISSFKEFDFENWSNSKINREYQITNPFFSTILYNKYLNVYYRISIHYQSVLNEDSSRNTFWDRSWSVIVLDSMLKVKYEVFFPQKMYKFSDLCVSPDGLLVSNNHELNVSFNPNYLSFSVFKLK